MPTRKETTQRRRLGRGLGSLISAPTNVEGAPGDAPAATTTATATATATKPADSGATGLPLASIQPNPHQPRKDFDEQALDALASSIRAAGVMQPVVVRPRADGTYELVAGERRWRAAQRAGLETIPAIVREADDRQAAEWSLIENLQREDLNPIERAMAFRSLIDEFGLKHQQVGEIVGMDRSSVTNHLRVLELDDQIQDVVRLGLLGLGHARALLALPEPADRRRLALKAAREGWSVRATEREVGRLAKRGGSTPSAPEEAPVSLSPRRAHLADMERRLGEHLGTKVHIRPGKKKGSGSVLIDFYDAKQFEGLMDRMGFACT
jgi:ParB family chromosome partitioning protein